MHYCFLGAFYNCGLPNEYTFFATHVNFYLIAWCGMIFLPFLRSCCGAKARFLICLSVCLLLLLHLALIIHCSFFFLNKSKAKILCSGRLYQTPSSFTEKQYGKLLYCVVYTTELQIDKFVKLICLNADLLFIFIYFE